MTPRFVFYIATTLLTIVLFSIAVSMVVPVNVLLLAAGFTVLWACSLVALKLFNGKLPHGLLMAVTAYGCATDVVGTAPATYTTPGDCLEEGSSAIGLILVKKGFNVGAIADAAAYAAAKTAKDIIPIKDVEAYWPVGSPVFTPSIGGRPDRLSRIDFEMSYKYEGVDANLHFQNALNQSRNYGMAFVTEEYKVFAPLDRNLEPVLCNWFAQPTAEQEYGRTRYMQGTIRWKGPDLVQLLDNAGLAKSVIIADFQP